MSSTLRSHGKNTVVWILMALLILGLGGFGMTSFSGSVRAIGAVGETEIDINDYARALRGEIDAASAQLGRRLTTPEALAAQLDKRVQGQLLGRAALEEQARIFGISVGDAQLQREITGARAFQGLDGNFDREAYRLALRQLGLNEGEYEDKLRAEMALTLVQGAVAGGLAAPGVQADLYTAYITETRAISYAEVTEADLADTAAAPDEAALRAFHAENPDRFTRPETRRISYVWLTPDMMLAEVPVDEDALRRIYQDRIAEFVQPERRLVERLVYPSTEEAADARARLDAGTASFADLAAERGLTLADADLGEVAAADLGAAGQAVFALDAPGVVGPVDTDLGPALFSMNAILAPQEITFDEVRDELAAEAALDRARRMILDQSADLEDLLAGGATLEDVAAETRMELGTIAFNDTTEDGIAGYSAFREAAGQVTQSDFPELADLEDGGVFALRLDGIDPPALIPFDEIRDQVEAAWRAEDLLTRKRAHAQEVLAAVSAGATLGSSGLLVTTLGTLPRGGFVEGMPAALAQTAFTLAEGAADIAEAEGRVILVQLDAIQPGDPADNDVQAVRAVMDRSIAQSLAGDLVDLFARAAQAEAGLTLDSTAINAVHAQMQ